MLTTPYCELLGINSVHYTSPSANISLALRCIEEAEKWMCANVYAYDPFQIWKFTINGEIIKAETWAFLKPTMGGNCTCPKGIKVGVSTSTHFQLHTCGSEVNPQILPEVTHFSHRQVRHSILIFWPSASNTCSFFVIRNVTVAIVGGRGGLRTERQPIEALFFALPFKQGRKI